MFDTIIHDGEIYHGLVLEKFNGGFWFGFRNNGNNYIWNCDTKYWKLVEGKEGGIN